jgi:hypothetical protein
MSLPKTVFVDIDGCVFEHEGKGACAQWGTQSKLLEGAREAFDEWEKKGYYIILVTSRKESCRRSLEYELQTHKLFWDLLIMGVPHGPRILINDKKKETIYVSCATFELPRNAGLKGVVNV